MLEPRSPAGSRGMGSTSGQALRHVESPLLDSSHNIRRLVFGSFDATVPFFGGSRVSSCIASSGSAGILDKRLPADDPDAQFIAFGIGQSQILAWDKMHRLLFAFVDSDDRCAERRSVVGIAGRIEPSFQSWRMAVASGNVTLPLPAECRDLWRHRQVSTASPDARHVPGQQQTPSREAG